MIAFSPHTQPGGRRSSTPGRSGCEPLRLPGRPTPRKTREFATPAQSGAIRSTRPVSPADTTCDSRSTGPVGRVRAPRRSSIGHARSLCRLRLLVGCGHSIRSAPHCTALTDIAARYPRPAHGRHSTAPRAGITERPARSTQPGGAWAHPWLTKLSHDRGWHEPGGADPALRRSRR